MTECTCECTCGAAQATQTPNSTPNPNQTGNGLLGALERAVGATTSTLALNGTGIPNAAAAALGAGTTIEGN